MWLLSFFASCFCLAEFGSEAYALVWQAYRKKLEKDESCLAAIRCYQGPFSSA